MSATRPLAASPLGAIRLRPAIDARWVEAAAAVCLIGVALALRLAHLWSIPQFTDETREALLAIQVLRGEDAGLVNVDAYIGGLYNWLLASIFWLTGPSAAVPRLVVAVAGALTVGATYLLARDVGGRPAGLAASALLASSGSHILANGHIAWSHCLTPLFTTLGAWLLQRAVRAGPPRAGGVLVGSGLAFGLALQTHPATLVLLPGAAIYMVWWGRAWLRTRWPYLALLLFLLGYANVVAYNVTTGGESIASAGEIREHYARGRPVLIDATTYLSNQLVHGFMLLRYLAGAVDARGDAASYLLDPSLWLYAALALGGLLLCSRGGAPLPLLMALSSVLILPYFNERKYVPISDGRYMMPVLPLAFCGLGVLGESLWRRATPTGHVVRAALLLGLLLLVAYPLVLLGRYFDQEISAGRTNDELFRTVAEVGSARRPQEAVLLDIGLRDVKFEGGGTAFRSLRFLLAGSGIQDRSVDNRLDYGRRMGAGTSALILMDAPAFHRVAADPTRLQALGVQTEAVSAPPTPRSYGIYRLERPGSLAQPTGGPTRATPQPASAAGPVPVEVIASGLVNPRGIVFTPDGSLLVAEAGAGGAQLIDVGRDKPHQIGRSGRVTRFSPSGQRSTLLQGLPSIVDAIGEEVGPTALAMLGDHLYLLTASGGWDTGDPDFHSGVFLVRPDGSLERIADLSAYTLEHPTRARLDDPRADVPAGMPYGMTAMNGRLYVTEANQEQLLGVGPSGEVTRITDYPKSNRALTGVAAGPDGALYVAEFAAAKVTRITLDGQITDAATKLKTPIGVAFDVPGSMYVLEYGGRVLRAAPVGQEQRDVLADGLREPTGMAFGPDGNLYVSVFGHKAGGGEGQIVRLRLAPAAGSGGRRLAAALSWLAGLVVLGLALGIGYKFRRRGAD